jgi:hypothetical protein
VADAPVAAIESACAAPPVNGAPSPEIPNRGKGRPYFNAARSAVETARFGRATPVPCQGPRTLGTCPIPGIQT